jgi:hypothetical protein
MGSRQLKAILLAASAMASTARAAPDEWSSRLAAFEETYRRALVASQRGDVDSTFRAAALLQSRWNELTRSFRQKPPPAYEGDPGWPAALEEISRAVSQARAAAESRRPAEAHALLEPVRRVLRDLRRRNGVEAFDDRLSDFHDAMERVLLRTGSTHEVPLTAEDRRGLSEDMAALTATLAELERASRGTCARLQELVREEARLVARLKAAVERGADERELNRESDRVHDVYQDLMLACR